MLGTSKDSKAAMINNNDYELFLQAFQKPTQIYKLLSYRHFVNPLFLHRTTSYMKHRRTGGRRTTKCLETVVKELNKKATNEERTKSREGSFKISITGIDNKSNATKGMETYDIRLFLHKITFKDKSEKQARRKLSLEHKLHIIDLFEKNPNLTVSAVAKDFGHSHSTVRQIKRESENIKSVGRAAGVTADSTAPSAEVTTEESEPPVANLKFTVNDKKSALRSPSKIPSVATIRSSTLAKHSSGQGCILELRVKLRSAKSNSKESSPSKKRRCVEEWFSAQVVVQNETGTTVLGDGSYTLFLRPMYIESWKPSQLSWESVSTKEEECYIKLGVLEADTDNCSSVSFDVKTDSLDVSSLTPKKSLSPKKAKRMSDGHSMKSDEVKGVLMYNFLYNGNTLQQTECRRNKVCPWCSVDCRRLYSLLEHITSCHPRFKVNFIPGLNGFDEIDVEVNEFMAMSHIARPDEESRVPIFSGPNRREPFQLQMLGSLTKERRSKSDFMVIDIAPYKAPHSRLYFHSKSYEPILPHEFEYDSENEEKMIWMEEKTKQLIQDFTDVNEAEKAIMIMWNCFILPIRPLADHQVPSLVKQFVGEVGREILKRDLTKNFILHLTNLHSFGLLKADDLESAMAQLYKLEDYKSDVQKSNSQDSLDYN